uniref:Ferritin n=1 Tax=Panagrellus redivivus TaxID=6233 RepID=A0A7E4W681_PANRE
MSGIRQNFDETSSTGLNAVTTHVLNASYFYLELACYFDRDDVALENVQKYFHELSEDKKKLADLLLTYQNARGGRTRFEKIAKPELEAEGLSIVDAFAAAIKVETHLNKLYADLHEVAEKANDAHFDDFIEDHLLGTEVEILKKLGDKHTLARKAGEGLGEFVFNSELED